MFSRNIMLILIFIANVGLLQADVDSSKDCKLKESKNCKNKRIGCCKLKYSGGGYDYVKATEDDCKSNENFHKFLGYENSLCMVWEEK